jgi:two-component system, chemotaxis family, protein-glutamate methylesterase/glutaminase
MASVSSSATAAVRRRRVLVVDDSPFIRRVVRDVIQGSPDFVVVGEACDGREALRQVHALTPDLVTLDVCMPVLDGLATLECVMREAPCPVVMLAARADGGDTTMRALELGAVDFVRKPAVGDALDLSTLEERLLGALRAAAGARIQSVPALPRSGVAARRGEDGRDPSGNAAREATEGVGSTGRRDATIATSLERMSPRSPGLDAVASGDARWLAGDQPAAAGVGDGAMPEDAVAPPHHLILIAASTGGPRALAEVVPALAPALTPEDAGRRAAIVIAQHMPTGFTESLARRLDALSPFPVREARDGEPLCGGRAYVAPGGLHTTIVREGGTLRLAVSAGVPVHGVAPAADPLFASAVAAGGTTCVAVVLTGMGHDGARGARALRAAGGRVVVQDAVTSIVHGMPQAAEQAAGADAVAPLHAVAEAVLDLLRRRPLTPAAASEPVGPG